MDRLYTWKTRLAGTENIEEFDAEIRNVISRLLNRQRWADLTPGVSNQEDKQDSQ